MRSRPRSVLSNLRRGLLPWQVAIASGLLMATLGQPAQAKGRLAQIAQALESVPESQDDRTLSPYFFVLSDNPKTDQLPLKCTRAKVAISGMIAEVTVLQEYRNQGKTTLEAIYIFPASTRAAVHGMKMTIGKRVIKARINKRRQARKKYEKAKRLGQTASLLEQMRPNVFQMNVANIRPGDRVQVELDYTELLLPQDTVYELVYPTVVGPRYSKTKNRHAPDSESWIENPYLRQGKPSPFDFSIEVKLSTGIPIARLFSPSHDVKTEFQGKSAATVSLTQTKEAATRDFVLRYSLAGARIQSGLVVHEGQEENYFLLMVEPPARVTPAQVVPREYIFILDVSGSMNGFPLEVSKQLIGEILNRLKPADSFNILLFAGGSDILAQRSLRASKKNVQHGIAWVKSHHGGGGTELLPALQRALALPHSNGTSRIVVVATDGYVTVEKQAYELVRKNLGQANLFTFGIGRSVNRELIEGLARAGMGEPFVVLDKKEARTQAARFREYVDSPLLQGVQVEFDGLGGYDVEPLAIPDLFANRPLVVFGKCRKSTGEIRISGTLPGGVWQRSIATQGADASISNSALPYLWARHRIRNLADMNLLGANDDRIAQVTALGLKYNLLTEYTSFVAIDKIVRPDGSEKRTVRQPLPLPTGVPDTAVGQAHSSFGYGGLGLIGTGRGGGGTGSGYGRGVGGLGIRRGSAATIRHGRATITGSVAKEVIIHEIKRASAKLRSCYQRALKGNPKIAGKLTVEFTVDQTGQVVQARIVSSTLEDKTIESCLLKLIRKLTFPRPSGTVVVRYPFTFNPSP